MDDPDVLLTNDDGIDSPGLGVLYETLSELGDVTVVAPAMDQSAVGRAMSSEAVVHEHELGYAVAGTPADCVVAGVQTLCPDPDLVVSGCNSGANLGAYVLGRSGTVSAAVEAAFFDVPAIAVSLYIKTPEDITFAEFEPDREDYREARRATRYLVEHGPDAGAFDRADYLNVNVPRPADREAPGRAPMRITAPSDAYEMDAIHENGSVRLHDRMWERMATGDVPGGPDSDRRALVEGAVSVSPLTAPHTVRRHEALDALAETYPGDG
jgi:5'-nucleotidase